MKYQDLKPEVFEALEVGNISAIPLELEFKKDFETYIFNEGAYKHCCILQVQELSKSLPSINGLRFSYEEFGVSGSSKSPFILIECQSSSALESFCQIIREVLNVFDNGEKGVLESLKAVLVKWRYFFAEPQVDFLSSDKIVGLLGELLVLKKTAQLYKDKAVSMWTANTGEEDFLSANKIVEVKSTQKDRHVHIINGIDQLVLKKGFTKHICSFLMTASSEESAVCLPSLIEKISSQFEPHSKEYDLFLWKLKSQGYDPRDAEKYRTFSFIIHKSAVFKVDGFFPSLTPDSLKDPLNPRISKVRYSLDMEGLSDMSFEEADFSNLL